MDRGQPQMTSPVVGIIHPGEMGAALAGELVSAGREVLWASQGRGTETHTRAANGGLIDAGTVDELASRSDILLSVCPPHAALDVALSVPRYTGTFVDANAVSPETARAIARVIESGGGRCVDGSIIGPPPRAAGDTRLLLSGRGLAPVSKLFAPTIVDVRDLGEEIGTASAVKMCYAAWTKGAAALLLAVRALARARGVETALLEEWARSQPRLTETSEEAARAARDKAWRWAGEMDEIAATFASSGLPGGWHESAAEIFSAFSRSGS